MQRQYLYLVNFTDHVLSLPTDIMYTIEAHIHGWQHVINSSTWFLFTSQSPTMVSTILQQDFERFRFEPDSYEIVRYGLPACGVQPTFVHQL